jgi:HSP20 family protein
LDSNLNFRSGSHFDKGVLHLNIKKPTEDAESAKTIEIKLGAPAKALGAPAKAAE